MRTLVELRRRGAALSGLLAACLLVGPVHASDSVALNPDVVLAAMPDDAPTAHFLSALEVEAELAAIEAALSTGGNRSKAMDGSYLERIRSHRGRLETLIEAAASRADKSAGGWQGVRERIAFLAPALDALAAAPVAERAALAAQLAQRVARLRQVPAAAPQVRPEDGWKASPPGPALRATPAQLAQAERAKRAYDASLPPLRSD